MSRADIYVDEQGRRRVDREGNKPVNADPVDVLRAQLVQMEARLVKLEADNTALRADLNGFTIMAGSSSVQISGSGPKGITIAIGADNDGGQPYGLELCDGTVITVVAFNVTPA